MREDVLKVRRVVLLRCKPGQAFLVDIYPEGVDGSEGDIDPQIPLVAVNQQWVLNVLLDQARGLAGTPRNLIERGDYLDSFALTTCLRLQDPKLVPILAHFMLQLLVLLGAVVRGWHEVEVFVSVEGLHARVPLVEAVLARYLVTAREVVNFLESAQAGVDVRLDGGGAPDQRDGAAVQEVAVRGVRDVVEVNRRHPVVLHRLLEAMLFEDPTDESIVKVGKLVEHAGTGQVFSPEPVPESLFLLRHVNELAA